MHLSWKRVRCHTRHPFRIARPGASVSGCDLERIIVRIEHDGVVGLGEAVPVPYYRQTLESAEQTLAAAGPLLGDRPEPIEPIIDRLLERFDDQRATVAAVDAALHDWLGRRRGLPLWHMLGLDPSATPPTSMTIGIDEPDSIARKVAEAAGFDILKIKVGTPQDEQTLDIVRRAAPTQRIRVDANCGWTADIAAERIAALARFDLELIEQPIPPGQIDAVRRLRDALGPRRPPIIADEDCVRPADVPKLAGAYDGINIKLCKCGGIVEALRMIAAARSLGLTVMLGCMVETSLGVAAAAHLASLVDYADLDGHLLLADDPFTGLQLERGIVCPGDRPGLGVALGEDAPT